MTTVGTTSIPLQGIWSASYWKAQAERSISTAAMAAILVLGGDILGDGAFNAAEIAWQQVAGYALGGAILSLLKGLAANAATGGGPGIGNAEVALPPGTHIENKDTVVIPGAEVTNSQGPGVSDVADGPLGPTSPPVGDDAGDEPRQW